MNLERIPWVPLNDSKIPGKPLKNWFERMCHRKSVFIPCVPLSSTSALTAVISRVKRRLCPPSYMCSKNHILCVPQHELCFC